MRTRWIALVCVATSAVAQGPLDDDLDRAAARYGSAASAPPDEADALAAQAGELFRSGRIDDAVASLDRAAAVAYGLGATGRSFELSLTAAEALRAAGRAGEAAVRFRDAALRNVRDPRAAAAHDAAIQTLRATLDGAAEETLDLYAELLRQHPATWPHAPTAVGVSRAWLELLARRGRWEELLAAARREAKGRPDDALLAGLIVAAHGGLLDGDPSPERFAEAKSELEPMFLYAPTPWPTAWSPLQRDAALTLARGACDQSPEGAQYAERVLRASLTGQPHPEAAWRRRAATLLAVLAARAGGGEQAMTWLTATHEGAREERQRLLDSALRGLLARGRNAELADRLAATLDALDGNAASELATANALEEAGRDDEARALYERRAAERPDDRGAQTDLARVLTQSGSAPDRERALALWRGIERRSPRGTPEWFEARLARLGLMRSLGHDDAAMKLLALTRLLAPDLGGEEFRARFEALEATGAPPSGDAQVAPPGRAAYTEGADAKDLRSPGTPPR